MGNGALRRENKYFVTEIKLIAAPNTPYENIKIRMVRYVAVIKINSPAKN